jgi:type I restriction enzyme, S subunit
MNGTRLKFLSHIEMGQSPSSEDCYEDQFQGFPFYQGTAEFGADFPTPKSYCAIPPKIANEGDILFSVRAPVGEININISKSGIGRGLCAIACSENINSRFLWWALHDSRVQLKLVSTGSTYEAVAAEDVGNMFIPSHTLETQTKIANYLDCKTAELDQLIGAKQRLLKLLDEKKRTLIARAVTRGLNPDIPLKDSGILWLGMIPAHWEVERTKWLLPEIDERSETGEEDLLSVSHLTGVTLRSEKDVNMFMAESLEGYKKCKAGDLVINTLWAWMGAMGVSPVDGIISPAYNVYRPVSGIDPDYIDLLVRTPDFVCEITRYSKGVWSSRLRLYPEGLYEACLPVPPLSEQKEIVVGTNKQLKRFKELKSITKKTIALLQERRTALISAAVTGKLCEEVLNTGTGTQTDELVATKSGEHSLCLN